MQLWPSESPRLGDLTPALRTISERDVGVIRGAARSSSPASVVERAPETLAFRDAVGAASRKMAMHRESMAVPAAVPETGDLS